MIVELKPYQAMKHSGVESLGKVPEDWAVRQLGRMGQFSKGKGGTKEDEVADGISCVRYGDIYMHHKFFIRHSQSFITKERAVDYTPIRYGDVLFTGSGETIDEIGKSAVNLIESEAYCGGDVIIFRALIEVESRFMGYATDCYQAVFQKACMGRGITVMHIYSNQLKYMWIALPSLPEQEAIVRFLDYMDRRISKYIRTKHKMIKLLEEQKQAVIHQAVTRGLDPDVPLKPSGVYWLGDIPDHWNFATIRRYCRVFAGATPSRANLKYWIDGTIPWLSSGDVNLRRIYNANQFITEEGFNSTSTRWIKPKSLVMALAGQGKTKGMVATIEKKMTCNQSLAAIDPLVKYSDYRFLTYYLSSKYKDIRGLVGDGKRDGLNLEIVKAIITPLPPVKEQVEIANYLDKVITIIDDLISIYKADIFHWGEFLNRLIADVVTGKLDVRVAAAKLPDEFGGQTELDDLFSDGSSLPIYIGPDSEDRRK